MMRALLSVALIPAVIGCGTGDPSAVGEGEEAVRSETNRVHLPDQASFFARPGGGGSSNLTYHNGPVIHVAHVVPIFWGPSWGAGGSDAGNASTIQSYVANFGTSSHYATITQYSDTAGKIQTSNLAGGPGAYFDSSTPPTNATDAAIQAEVTKAIAAVGFDASAIYEVFLPSSSYSSDGTATSCGGPKLDVLRVPRQLQRLARRHALRVDAVSELRRLPDERLQQRAEHRALHLARDARSRDRCRRHRLVRSPRLRGRRQVRLVADAVQRLERLRVPVRVVERRRRLRPVTPLAFPFSSTNRTHAVCGRRAANCRRVRRWPSSRAVTALKSKPAANPAAPMNMLGHGGAPSTAPRAAETDATYA